MNLATNPPEIDGRPQNFGWAGQGTPMPLNTGVDLAALRHDTRHAPGSEPRLAPAAMTSAKT